MNIQFQISAPASLSIFGEYTKSKLKASINLRTTLTFQETSAWLSNNIEIEFFQINLLHKISLQDFSNFYICFENTELLRDIILQLPFHYESNSQKIFLQMFYYLFVLIKYKEQIEIKPFKIIIATEIISE